ncbi:dihydrofolate reductase [Arctopsyche grandis]|uniref:dihydrofolate reductase n=1 Tax=Arctopsyche grandis TaxID=121162 RepID=UPI00406D7280
MSNIRLNLIAAACENMGIGKNNDIPWKLKKEMAYFNRMTKTTIDPTKQNLVIMGRRTWDSVPEKYRPFSGRLNLVLTKQPDVLKSTVPSDVMVFGSLDEAVKAVATNENIEKIWIIGGSHIYKEAINHPCCDQIYLTEIRKSFDCDTFFPEIGEGFKLLDDHSAEAIPVPIEKQSENDVEYYFRIYKRIV